MLAKVLIAKGARGLGNAWEDPMRREADDSNVISLECARDMSKKIMTTNAEVCSSGIMKGNM